MYKAENKIIYQEPIPSYEDDTHIITPCTSHKDLWVWTSKKNPTSMFSMTASMQWIKDNCQIISSQIGSPILHHFNKGIV